MRNIKTDSFVITADVLDNKSLEAKDIAKLKKLGYVSYFELYDDDEELYYRGYLHKDCEDEFEPLDWGMYDSGCTDIKYRNKLGKMEIL